MALKNSLQARMLCFAAFYIGLAAPVLAQEKLEKIRNELMSTVAD